VVVEYAIARFKSMGKNARIYHGARIICPENIEIGDESVIDDLCFIYAVGRGIKIGRFCHICVQSVVQAGGRVEMMDFSALAPGCILMAATDDYQGNGFIGLKVLDKYRVTRCLDVTLEKHAHVGMGSRILPGVTIGEGCSVGAGSLVTKSLPPWTICYGSPCKPVKDKPKEYQLEMEKRFLEEYYGSN
jgi:acetyltransferase-like isoleucine patch superfamily enzyme